MSSKLNFNNLKDSVTTFFDNFKDKEGNIVLSVLNDLNGIKIELYNFTFDGKSVVNKCFVEKTHVFTIVTFFNLKSIETFPDFQTDASEESIKIFELLAENWIALYMEVEKDVVATTYSYSVLVKNDSKKECRKTKSITF